MEDHVERAVGALRDLVGHPLEADGARFRRPDDVGEVELLGAGLVWLSPSEPAAGQTSSERRCHGGAPETSHGVSSAGSA